MKMHMSAARIQEHDDNHAVAVSARVATRVRAASIRLWSPGAEELDGLLNEAIAISLATAFSSGVWARTPMPVGERSDPHSARGIIAGLRRQSRVMLASVREPGVTPEAQRVIGCVLGGVMDEKLITAYRLDAYGARAGDGLLAYIGVVPSAQGMRLSPLPDGCFQHSIEEQSTQRTVGASTSLAGALFSSWLALPEIRSCPAVFVRTREVLKPVLHMLAKSGFEYAGRFDLEFRGERQERLVFKRETVR